MNDISLRKEYAFIFKCKILLILNMLIFSIIAKVILNKLPISESMIYEWGGS